MRKDVFAGMAMLAASAARYDVVAVDAAGRSTICPSDRVRVISGGTVLIFK